MSSLSESHEKAVVSNNTWDLWACEVCFAHRWGSETLTYCRYSKYEVMHRVWTSLSSSFSYNCILLLHHDVSVKDYLCSRSTQAGFLLARPIRTATELLLSCGPREQVVRTSLDDTPAFFFFFFFNFWHLFGWQNIFGITNCWLTAVEVYCTVRSC